MRKKLSLEMNEASEVFVDKVMTIVETDEASPPEVLAGLLFLVDTFVSVLENFISCESCAKGLCLEHNTFPEDAPKA